MTPIEWIGIIVCGIVVAGDMSMGCILFVGSFFGHDAGDSALPVFAIWLLANLGPVAYIIIERQMA